MYKGLLSHVFYFSISVVVCLTRQLHPLSSGKHLFVYTYMYYFCCANIHTTVCGCRVGWAEFRNSTSGGENLWFHFFVFKFCKLHDIVQTFDYI